MGDRRPFRLEQGLASEFAVCDNRWHHVSAQYAEGKLTLRVDHMEQTYWLADHGHLTTARTGSPLYIGGVPGMHNFYSFLKKKRDIYVIIVKTTG